MQQIKMDCEFIAKNHLDVLNPVLEVCSRLGFIYGYPIILAKEITGLAIGLRFPSVALTAHLESFPIQVCQNFKDPSPHLRIFYLSCFLRGRISAGYAPILDLVFRLVDEMNVWELFGGKDQVDQSCFTYTVLSASLSITFINNQEALNEVEHCLFRALFAVKRKSTAMMVVEIMRFMAAKHGLSLCYPNL
jgi:hypothetical protein